MSRSHASRASGPAATHSHGEARRAAPRPRHSARVVILGRLRGHLRSQLQQWLAAGRLLEGACQLPEALRIRSCILLLHDGHRHGDRPVRSHAHRADTWLLVEDPASSVCQAQVKHAISAPPLLAHAEDLARLQASARARTVHVGHGADVNVPAVLGRVPPELGALRGSLANGKAVGGSSGANLIRHALRRGWLLGRCRNCRVATEALRALNGRSLPLGRFGGRWARRPAVAAGRLQRRPRLGHGPVRRRPATQALAALRTAPLLHNLWAQLKPGTAWG
mmetsp:Transcript_20663/g.57075  ORF Transcript_20663/g.57075 Transcript_20663/m.57075 type:complete len:279 (-) Transcript_20663:822-1658(-)